jgi:hypothetical protein
MDSPSVQTMLGAAGGCPEIILRGKAWKIGHPTQRAKESLERLAVTKATQEITSLKGVVDASAYSELFEAHKRDITSGSYRTWGEGWQRITFAPQNAHLFLLSLLRENHPEATERDARALALGAREEVELTLAQVVPGFFSMLLDEMPLPPEQRQAVQTRLVQVMQQFKQRTPPTSAV